MHNTCVVCGAHTPRLLGIFITEEGKQQLGGLGFHCGRCAAKVMADQRGEELHYLEIAPIAMHNAQGRRCVFHFQYMTTGPVPGLRACEIEGYGYEAAVVERPGESYSALFERLLEKLRALLARSDLKDAPRTSTGLAMTGSEIHGRLEYDVDTHGPCVVVDGRKLDWMVLGDLLMSHEGFDFRLEFDLGSED